MAWSRCSSVTYSCRRRRASATAFWRVCCSSFDTVTIRYSTGSTVTSRGNSASRASAIVFWAFVSATS